MTRRRKNVQLKPRQRVKRVDDDLDDTWILAAYRAQSLSESDIALVVGNKQRNNRHLQCSHQNVRDEIPWIAKSFRHLALNNLYLKERWVKLIM